MPLHPWVCVQTVAEVMLSLQKRRREEQAMKSVLEGDFGIRRWSSFQSPDASNWDNALSCHMTRSGLWASHQQLILGFYRSCVSSVAQMLNVQTGSSISHSSISEASFHTNFFPSHLSVNVMPGRGKFIKHFHQNCFSINQQRCKNPLQKLVLRSTMSKWKI